MKIRIGCAVIGIGLLAAVSSAVPTSAQAGVVPNMYHCSTHTQQCWQTNKPHVASIINECYWYSDYVYNAAWASTTCGRYTPN